MNISMNTPTISWDWGTAYDLFASLRVLHEPAHYGLRPAWAAGVRSRVPAQHRGILEQIQSFFFMPRQWIYDLPAPKDGAAVVWTLSQMQPEERLLTLVAGTGVSAQVLAVLQKVIARGNWNPADQEALRAAYVVPTTPPRSKAMITMLALFSQAADSGERYLHALQSYYQVFFAEEEKHIRPFLEAAVHNAQKLAGESNFNDLIEALSYGVRLQTEHEYPRWVFVPSYWISPLVTFDRLSNGQGIFLFGGRPPDVSLVSGEIVPDAMLRALKTLGDPTRLRILGYLSRENIPPAELARRLRLRAPTVTHHLNVLRLAGLVYLTIGDKNERRYAARLEAIDEMYVSLKDFLAAEAGER
jgi:DNA-binding transcriptional ArsR family regulator